MNSNKYVFQIYDFQRKCFKNKNYFDAIFTQPPHILLRIEIDLYASLHYNIFFFYLSELSIKYSILSKII